MKSIWLSGFACMVSICAGVWVHADDSNSKFDNCNAVLKDIDFSLKIGADGLPAPMDSGLQGGSFLGKQTSKSSEGKPEEYFEFDQPKVNPAGSQYVAKTRLYMKDGRAEKLERIYSTASWLKDVVQLDSDTGGNCYISSITFFEHYLTFDAKTCSVLQDFYQKHPDLLKVCADVATYNSYKANFEDSPEGTSKNLLSMPLVQSRTPAQWKSAFIQCESAGINTELKKLVGFDPEEHFAPGNPGSHFATEFLSEHYSACTSQDLAPSVAHYRQTHSIAIGGGNPASQKASAPK